VGEVLPGYEASAWFGVGAPKARSAEIVDKLNGEINAGLADPRIKARLADFGAIPMLTTPADFGKFIAEETEKWAKVVKFSGPSRTDGSQRPSAAIYHLPSPGVPAGPHFPRMGQIQMPV
jgi:Tripartite tricarboxylate transporter family receptor